MKRSSPCEKGFTLAELLIVVAIVGVLAAVLIPRLLDALDKANQKRTMEDIRAIGTAWMAYTTDQVGAAAAGSSATVVNLNDYLPMSLEQLESVLVPTYIQAVKIRWPRIRIRFRCGDAPASGSRSLSW